MTTTLRTVSNQGLIAIPPPLKKSPLSSSKHGIWGLRTHSSEIKVTWQALATESVETRANIYEQVADLAPPTMRINV
jgi:hypothetical protein